MSRHFSLVFDLLVLFLLFLLFVVLFLFCFVLLVLVLFFVLFLDYCVKWGREVLRVLWMNCVLVLCMCVVGWF